MNRSTSLSSRLNSLRPGRHAIAPDTVVEPLPMLGPQCREYLGGAGIGAYLDARQRGEDPPVMLGGGLLKDGAIYWSEEAATPRILRWGAGIAGAAGFGVLLLAGLMLAGWLGGIPGGAAAAVPVSALLFGVAVVASRRAARSSGETVMVARFRRASGMVSVPQRSGAAPMELHFDGFEAFLVSEPADDGRIRYRLMLRHRRPDVELCCPEVFTERWRVHHLWEVLQQFMDADNQLPDLPQLEAMREQDPASIGFDRQRRRPPKYWKEMYLDRARELEATSRKAALAYPWGLSRFQAIAQGWTPSGVGEGGWIRRR